MVDRIKKFIRKNSEGPLEVRCSILDNNHPDETVIGCWGRVRLGGETIEHPRVRDSLSSKGLEICSGFSPIKFIATSRGVFLIDDARADSRLVRRIHKFVDAMFKNNDKKISSTMGRL